MFFSLVDYGGKQANTKINLLNVDGKRIDDTWRVVHIPLSSFHAASKGVNLENIKELRIEFQRQGFVHLDAIQIVPFLHEERKLRHEGLFAEACPLPWMKINFGGEWEAIRQFSGLTWDGSSLSLNYNEMDWTRNGMDLVWL